MRFVTRSEPHEDAVDLRLCADVDATSRLVEDEDARTCAEPLADDDFLLVAAAERAPQCPEPAGRHDVHLCRADLGNRPLFATVDEAQEPG